MDLIVRTGSRSIACGFCDVEQDLGLSRRGEKKFMLSHIWSCTIRDDDGTTTPYFITANVLLAEPVVQSKDESE